MKLFDVYPLYDVTPVSAKGIVVTDDKGQEYLDFYGGHAVISIGHSHPHYVKRLQHQLNKIGFYSNSVKNPLQEELAGKLGQLSGCEDYDLFLCNSGAEANENALKMASFHTGKSRVIAFNNSFHGRTSAAVAATDNPKINAPINQQQKVTFLPFDDVEALETEMQKEDVCAVILEAVQGVGGLDQPSTEFYQNLERLCSEHGVVLIADEVQSGFGRTGKFFAFQHHVSSEGLESSSKADGPGRLDGSDRSVVSNELAGLKKLSNSAGSENNMHHIPHSQKNSKSNVKSIRPDIISIAKGMGNGFPVGGILIHKTIKASYGLLGTTFGGNHLACAATLAVLEVLEEENLMDNADKMESYFRELSGNIPQIKRIKGRGLMLGLEFPFDVAGLRKRLIYDQHLFTGGAKNKQVLRILPALNINKGHLDALFEGLAVELKAMEKATSEMARS